MQRQALLEVVGNRGVSRQLAAGEILCHEDDAETLVFLVDHGSIDVVINAPHGEIVLATHGPGALLGEVTAVIGGRRTATLRAAAPSSVKVVSPEVLIDVMDGEPELAASILSEARERSERTRVATHLAESLNSNDSLAIGQIASLVTWVNLRAGEVLFREGDVADGAYLVTAGRLRVETAAGDVLADVGRGEIIGEAGLIAGQVRAASISALRDCTMARLSAEDFRTLTQQSPDLAIGLVSRVLARMAPGAPKLTRPSRLVALVHLEAPSQQETVSGVFADALHAVGSTAHLTRASVGVTLSDPDVADCRTGSFDDVRLTELFHYAESNHDQVFLESADETSLWTERILRQADQIVIACPARISPEVERRVRDLFDGCPDRVPLWLMLMHSEGTKRPVGSARIFDRFEVDELHHVRGLSEEDLGRVARLAAGRGVGVVLSGGGARGFAHIGVIQALEESGVPIDRIAGTSMGSIVGAAIAQRVPQQRRVTTMSDAVSKLFDYTVPLVSLIKAERITTALTNQFGNWDMRDLWIPFACVSTNLTTSEVVVHRSGRVERMVRASISLPGIMPPVVIDGDLLVDGGILQNLPVQVMATDPSISTIIAADVSPPDGPSAETDPGLSVSGWKVLRSKFDNSETRYPAIGAVLMRALLLGSAQDREAAVQSGVIDLYLDLDVEEIGLLDFESVEAAVKLGYESARERVAAWAAPRSDAPM